jgi:CrcB protein
MHYLAVFIGGGVGAATRHAVNRAALAWLGPGFPWGTLIVNVIGGLLMGALAQLFLIRTGLGQEVRLLLSTGLLGGFTTFSAFSLDSALMWQRGEWTPLLLYVAGSVLLSIAALFAGMAAVRTALGA